MDRIKVQLSRTINLGNYESIKVELGMESDVGEEEDAGLAIKNTTENLIQSILIQSKKFKRAVKPKKRQDE